MAAHLGIPDAKLLSLGSFFYLHYRQYQMGPNSYGITGWGVNARGHKTLQGKFWLCHGTDINALYELLPLGK